MRIRRKIVGITILILFSLIIVYSCYKFDKKPETLNSVDNIEILLDLSTKVYEKQHSKALQYALTALDLSIKRKNEAYEALSSKAIGDIYTRLNYSNKALPYYRSALYLFKKQKQIKEITEVQQSLGDVFYALNYSDSALYYYNVTLKRYQELGDKLAIGTAFSKIGNVYWITNNFDKSLEYYLNTLNIFDDLKNSEGLTKIYIKIGLIYYITSYYDKSLEYFAKSEKILEENYDKDVQADLYYRMGASYSKMNNNNEALKYFDLSLKLYQSLSNELRVAWVYHAKSQTIHNQGKNKEAIELTKTAMKIGGAFDDKWLNTTLHTSLANYQIDMKKYDEALQNLQTAELLAKQLKNWTLQKDIFLCFSKYYDALDQYKASLNYYKKFQQLSDSIQNKDRNERIVQLQTRFETERNKQELRIKEQEINKSKAKLQKQKYQLYIFAFGVLLVLVLSFGLYRQYKILEIKGKKIERINEELDQRVKERTSALRLTQFSVDQASDPIYWLSPAGNYIFANKAGCDHLEYTKGELEHLNIIDVLPNFNKHDWEQFWEIIKNDKSLNFESYHKKKSGSIFPVEITLNYVDHEESEFAFAYVRDISERKHREENLKKAKEKAEEADKLKSAFLANMSHEIRTPMNAIIGFSDLLMSEEYNEEEKKEFGNLIKNSGSSLLKLIDDIIDISIMEAGHLKLNMASVDVNYHLNEIAMFFIGDRERLGKSSVDIKLNLPPDSDKIRMETDPVRFRQVINNLVGNALKFTEQGSIELGYTIGSDPVLHFYVKDSGIGIRAEKIGLIFERFNKLDDERRIYAGTGLGLTISKKIVEELGGFIYVESEYGKGSKFSFTLPYYTLENYKKNGLLEIDTPREKKYNWENKKILVVEDVESNYLFLETLISKTKAKISWAKTGKQALEFCNSIQPDIILMDIQLPELNGYDATKLIRKKNPTVPIIAQTAYAFAGEKEKIFNSGCNDYITKPIKPKTLMDTINKYFG
jgi:PAS domain S-box-containing protein